jgi:hypothetical protein
MYYVSGTLVCPEGTWAVGLYGTADTYIDSIGLICDTSLTGVVATPAGEGVDMTPYLNGLGLVP